MERVVILVLFLMTVHVTGQSKDYNVKKGYAVNGYDVVSYFEGEAMEGDKAYVAEHDGIKYKFATKEHLEAFNSEPKKYLPKYGGYCAYAVAVAGKKVSVNPETFEIRDGALYLFYNSGRNNTLESWLKESPEQLKLMADKNWKEILLK